MLAFVHRATRFAPRDGEILHGIDILWTAALTFVSSGPGSPFFLFFLFIQLSAAYRWGFRETVLTTAVTVGIFLFETGIAGAWNPSWVPWRDLATNRTILRVTYFVLTGCLIGYLAEQEKELRAEIAAVADAARQPRVELGLGGSVTAVSRQLLGSSTPPRWTSSSRTSKRGGRCCGGSSPTTKASRRGGRCTWSWIPRSRRHGCSTIRDRHGTPARRPDGSDLSVRVVEAGVWPLQRRVGHAAEGACRRATIH